MANILDNLKYQFKSGGMFIKLIFINVAVFVFFNLIATIAALMKWDDLFITFSNGRIFTPTQWFSFSTDPELVITRPWTTITYMFMHGGSFKGGSRKKKDIAAMGNYFSSRGWVFVSIDYRVLKNLGTIHTGIAPQKWIDASIIIRK